MTAERFTCDNNYYKGLILKDNLTNEILEEDGIGGYDNACDKLNELAEENEQLKTFLESLKEELSLANRDNTTLEKENEQLKSELLDIEEDRDYYKSKASSLEEGYLQLQDREIRLKKENEQLKQTIINLIENGLNELFGDKYRIIEDIGDVE